MVSIYNNYNENIHFIGPDSTVTIFSIGSMFIFSVHYLMFPRYVIVIVPDSECTSKYWTSDQGWGEVLWYLYLSSFKYI